LVSGRTRTLGLIVSEITNPFFPEIIQAFEDVALEHNYEIQVASTIHDSKQMKLSVRRMIERRVEGVAVITFGSEESILQDLQLRNMPLVFVDVGPRLPQVSNIRVDYKSGLRQAVQHLAALRHTEIGFISGPLELKSAEARHEAFVACSNEIALQVRPEFLLHGDHTMEGAIKAVKPLLRESNRPTALVCSNDMTAIGVMREAYECGLRVPHDLSVIGFDDIKLTQFVIPALTTVQMSQDQLAKLAFQALLNEIQTENPSANGSEYPLETRLVIRDSTGPANL
jgi:DNA-binding LacI/PurR family transcriptional regulator